MAYEFDDIEELTFELLHGAKSVLISDVKHTIIFPKKMPNTSQDLIMFYVSRDRLIELKKHAEHVFGDSDFTKSLSRYITAGTHWMDKTEDVKLLQHLTGRKQHLERDIVRLKEEWKPLNEDYEMILELKETALDELTALNVARKLLAAAPVQFTTKGLIKELWSQLMLKLVPKWALRK